MRELAHISPHTSTSLEISTWLKITTLITRFWWKITTSITRSRLVIRAVILIQSLTCIVKILTIWPETSAEKEITARLRSLSLSLLLLLSHFVQILTCVTPCASPILKIFANGNHASCVCVTTISTSNCSTIYRFMTEFTFRTAHAPSFLEILTNIYAPFFMHESTELPSSTLAIQKVPTHFRDFTTLSSIATVTSTKTTEAATKTSAAAIKTSATTISTTISAPASAGCANRQLLPRLHRPFMKSLHVSCWAGRLLCACDSSCTNRQVARKHRPKRKSRHICFCALKPRWAV
mmetsp:Transcript_35392/g.57336  ORF Transcript_35392/g.57336 Transcript_35392/m.57336 type:complete len:293 (-) Transcript_35392:318-1196(-)